MNGKRLRKRSAKELRHRKLFVPKHLPLLVKPETGVKRALDEVVSRTLCLTTVAAVAHGLDPDIAIKWIRNEGLNDDLTVDERSFLQDGKGDRDAMKDHVQSVALLCWTLKILPELDPWSEVPDDLVTHLPDPRKSESGDVLGNKANLRDSAEIAAHADLLYCLHWNLVHCQLNRLPLPQGLSPFTVIPRRRAIEWLVCDEEWSNVPLDT